ncbi:MAG: hypothetical protein HYT72_03965 [Candidatus Aenigmarchaeota archaeon]|nr:hypothetical protein [Candidatus Aenigmarchaeota archaeon]
MFPFRNLFKQNRQEALKIDIGEVPSFLESKEIKNRQKAFLEKMNSDFSLLRNHLNSLASKNSPNNYSNMLKNKFCSRSLSIIETAEENISAYKGAISEIGSIDMKEFRHLHAFSDDMKLIAARINSIAKESEEAERFLESNPLFRKTRETQNKLEKITALRKINESLAKEIAVIKDEIAEKERLLKRKDEELKSFSAREEFKFSESLDEEIKYFEKNKNTIRQKIVEEFAGIDRPMRKFRHSKICESMLKEYRDTLDAYIESGEALFSDSDFRIKKILESMKRAADASKRPESFDAQKDSQSLSYEKQMDIEEKKYQRLIDILRNAGLLESLRDEYLSLIKKIAQLKEEKDKYNGLFSEKKHRKSELAELEKSVVTLRKSLETKAKEKAGTEKEIATETEGLESMLREILGREVVIS